MLVVPHERPAAATFERRGSGIIAPVFGGLTLAAIDAHQVGRVMSIAALASLGGAPLAYAATGVLVDLLTALAKRIGASNAQVALARLLAQHPSIVTIPGTTKIHRMTENTASADVVLSAEDLAEITAAADQVDVTGEWCTEENQRWIDR